MASQIEMSKGLATANNQQTAVQLAHYQKVMES